MSKWRRQLHQVFMRQTCWCCHQQVLQDLLVLQYLLSKWRRQLQQVLPTLSQGTTMDTNFDEWHKYMRVKCANATWRRAKSASRKSPHGVQACQNKLRQHRRSQLLLH